jgi:hypothetical protein
MSGNIPLLALYAFMAWTETALPFYLVWIIECDLEGNRRGQIEVQSRYLGERTEEMNRILRIAGNPATIRMRHLSNTRLGLLLLHQPACVSKYYHCDLFVYNSMEQDISSEVKTHLVKKYFHGNRRSVTVFRRAHLRSLFWVKAIHIFTSYLLYIQHNDNFPSKLSYPYFSVLFRVLGYKVL